MVNKTEFVIHIEGPDISLNVKIFDSDDLALLDKALDKIRRKFAPTLLDAHDKDGNDE